ncbi:MAG: hypothetical protein ACK5XN_25410, partial [Bacteroidota bacterium]
MTIETQNHAEEQAAAQYSSIVQMLAAVECDYDRLTELKDEREELTEAVKDAEDVEDVEERLAEDLSMLRWEVDNASGSTECEAWRGQYEIDCLT